jgi:hypothetical protein
VKISEATTEAADLAVAEKEYRSSGRVKKTQNVRKSM